MQPSRPQPRAPGSFAPLVAGSNSATTPDAVPQRPMIRKIDTSSSGEDMIQMPKTRTPQTPTFPISPTSRASPQNFSRPSRPGADPPASVRNASPLTLPPTRSGHQRKHSSTQGHFEPSLPSTSTSNLSHVAMSPALSASQIAAQAAMQSQQNLQFQHTRHRSQTVPFPAGAEPHDPSKRPAPNPVQRSPPLLSLTEASAPRDNGFGSQGYHNGLLGSNAATAAANVVFPRTSPQTSPGLSTPELSMPPPPAPVSQPVPEKPLKSEKSKVKLFSRPKKIDTKGEVKERPLPSPGKIGSALASLQRANFSTTSLADSQSFYNMANSSSATIRPTDSPVEREKDKEKRHHFLSRQKHKLTNKDEYHLPLSSAASNSRPTDPSAPTSLYNFNVPPPSPGPASNLGKSVSGLDLRHGGRALREKRKEEKHGDTVRHENDPSFALGGDWASSGLTSAAVTGGSSYFLDQADSAKYGLNNMSMDDAWPYLKAKLLVVFEGEDLRLPIEDFNRIVTLHIQYCIQRRSAHIIVEDLRDLLSTGFASLDHALRRTPEDRVIPALVELWIITFTSILPYMQSVFLPLDLEFSGAGTLLSPEQARDFWGGVVAGTPGSSSGTTHVSPASEVLEVRRLVLMAFRDILILPRYEKLKTIFSRLSLEHLPSSLASLALASPPPINDGMASLSSSPPDAFARPGTAMSLDPSVASYNSNSTTVFGNDSNPSRSRAISNVSYGSGASDTASAAGGSGSLLRPFTPSARDGVREQNVEDSKQVTEMVGRLLQCMSVLAGVGIGTPMTMTVAGATDEPSKMVSELGRLLKLNWLGRGRTGRNRRGMVGGRVKRPDHGNKSSISILRETTRESVGVSG
ncbi:HbrB-like protein [Xylariaceae sp. FL0255]|nr:HbrB-like protein [Xylariaceae sp. FL0255]